jgi:hypothetical protein
MTKPCKHCKEPIDANASKCPKCQGSQKWYNNPQAYSFFIFIPIIVFSLYNSYRVLAQSKFSDHSHQILVKLVGEELPQVKGTGILLNLEIENTSKKTWKHPHFQVLSFDEQGKILVVENFSEYGLVLAPNTKTLTTLTLRTVPEKMVASRKISLTDARSDRY